MDVNGISLVLSALAVIVSWITHNDTLDVEKKRHEQNIEAEYFSAIYKSYLVERIPMARRKIGLTDGKIKGVSEMIDILKKLEQDSLYYKFKDEDYYNEMQYCSQGLQDYLSQQYNKRIINETEEDVLNTINIKIEELYKCINNRLIV